MTKAKKLDRRVQRTRQLLQDALIAMVIEKGYDATTVQDIIDRANVGRATFYAHFPDKQTLLTSRLEDLRVLLTERRRQVSGPLGFDLRVLLTERRRQVSGPLGFSLAMFEHARSHLPLYRAIVGRESGAFIVQRIHRTIADLAELDLKALGFNGAPEQRRLAVEFLAGAFMAVLTWWLDEGAMLPPEEIDGIVRRLVMQGLAIKLA